MGALSLALVAGCSGGATSPNPTATPVFDGLADPVAVPVLLRRELGEDIVVRRVTLYDYGFRAEVRDPQHPQNLDEYSYAYGRWDTEPVSVSQYDIDRLDRTTFRLGAVDWSVIPGLQERALADLDLEDETISIVSVDRIEGQPQPRIYIAVSGARGYGSLLADARGGHVTVTRN